jgi:hypothetical protein
MKEISYEDLNTDILSYGAILHTHAPFVKDYLTLHILLKKYDIKSVMEIGTHIGEGTNIICNAVPKAKVYSLDLPLAEAKKTLQHPSLKDMGVGQICKFPYTQLYGDSMAFDYPVCETWFIDGEHDYAHPRHETSEAIKQKAKLIIWHDADMTEVFNAIHDSFIYNGDYELYRVTGTATAYAIRIEK